MGKKTLVKLIAVWMLLISLPWIQYFAQQDFMPKSLLDGLGLAGVAWILFCAAGLAFNKEMARTWAVWMLGIYFLWSFYLVIFNIAPFFSASVEWLSLTYHLPIEVLRSAMLMLIITHILWPLIVVMYLTNPNVKSTFN
jgi:hypothetical protein